MMAYGKTSINQDISSKIVDILTETLQRIQRVLQPSPIPGREHYLFSLRHMIIVIQSLRYVDVQLRNQKTFLAPFLKHELYRIINDQLVREIDQYWFKDTLNEIFRNVKNKKNRIFFLLKFIFFFENRFLIGIKMKKIIFILHFHWKEEVMNVHLIRLLLKKLKYKNKSSNKTKN
jgi:hypothetical protein